MNGCQVTSETLAIGTAGKAGTVCTIVVEQITVCGKAGEVVYGSLSSGGIRTTIGDGESAGNMCGQVNLVGSNSCLLYTSDAADE